MVWRMLFADFCALIAYVGAQRAELFRQRGDSAHPATGHRADIRTFPAKPQTPLHELRIGLMLHSDHIICTLVADLRATKTRCDTVFPFRCQRSFILMHGWSPFPISQMSPSVQIKNEVKVSLPQTARHRCGSLYASARDRQRVSSSPRPRTSI
jgi:hypothetical protein